MTLITLVLAFFVMLAVVAGMAVGVVFGRKPISGSCGGLSALGGSAPCEICGGNPARCDSETNSGTDSGTNSGTDSGTVNKVTADDKLA